MEQLCRIFEREYNSEMIAGLPHKRAVYWAIDHIETCVRNVKERFNYDEFKRTHAEYYDIYESEKTAVKEELEQIRINQMRKKAVIGYHPADSIFRIKTKKGTYNLKVVEQNSCCGCFFSRITGQAQAGYDIYGCIYDNKTKNAYCSAEMREDNKTVAYKRVK